MIMANYEVWKDVDGYEGKYQVSSLGKVKSIKRTIVRNEISITLKGKLLSIKVEKNGSRRVDMSIDGKSKLFLVHRVVAEAFIENPDAKKYVKFRDGDRSNIIVSNLAWATNKERLDEESKESEKTICCS